MMILKWIAFGMKRLVFVSFYRNSQTIRATRWIFRTMLAKKKRYVVYTYSLIVLIKLDFPAPAMPVIAMCTSTSLHPPISLLLKKYAMESGLRRPFFSTSFWKILYIFRFPIHSDRMAGNRAIRSLLRTEVGLNNNKALLYWRVHVTKHSRPSCFCATSSHPEEEFWVAIATFETYGWKFTGYLILICSLSSC